MSGFILNGKTYTHVDLADILVGDQIRVERWLAKADISEARTWEDVIAIAKEINQLPNFAAQKAHPEFRFSITMTVWLARRAAGEDVTLDEALQYRFDDVTWLNDEGVVDDDDDEGDEGKGSDL